MPILSEGILGGNWFTVPKLNRRGWKNILHTQGYVQPCSSWKCLAFSITSPFLNHAYPTRSQIFNRFLLISISASQVNPLPH